MAKIHYTNKAVEDLTSIWSYTASSWSVKQADNYYNQLISTIQKVAGNPFIPDKSYSHISDGLLGHKFSRHLIFYKRQPTGDIKIIRILHDSMDLPAHLK